VLRLIPVRAPLPDVPRREKKVAVGCVLTRWVWVRAAGAQRRTLPLSGRPGIRREGERWGARQRRSVRYPIPCKDVADRFRILNTVTEPSAKITRIRLVGVAFSDFFICKPDRGPGPSTSAPLERVQVDDVEVFALALGDV
jgi:hypothetical protein